MRRALVVLMAFLTLGASAPALYPNSWALVIGINKYQHVPGLTYAVADAKAVAEALPGLGFPKDKTRVLLNEEASKARIESTLYRDLAKMGPEDRLFVFFAGHGETSAIRGGEEGYLLPVDAEPDALPLTAIPMDEIKRISQRLKGKHYLFVMDACFSGFAATRDVAPKSTTGEYLAVALREPVVQVITAGRKGEQAIEDGGHGLFTRRLLDGLRGLADADGRGLITAAQLAAWIEPRVVRDAKGKMTPQYGTLDGEGQFVFVRPAVRTAAVAPPAAPQKVEIRDEVLRVLDELGRTSYAKFLAAEPARAFALSDDGRWGWVGKRESRPVAAASALYQCNESARNVCRIYSVNDEIVYPRYAAFDERSREALQALAKERFVFSEYGDEARDFGVRPPEALRRGDYHADTPLALTGVRTIPTAELVKTLRSPAPPVLIDVLEGGAHKTLPGAYWLRARATSAATTPAPRTAIAWASS